MAKHEEAPVCPGCARPLEECVCACPYCGQSEACTCAVGYGVATGG